MLKAGALEILDSFTVFAGELFREWISEHKRWI